MKRVMMALAALQPAGRLRRRSAARARSRRRRPSASAISVLTSEASIEVDPALADMPVTVPAGAGQCRLAAAGRQCRPSRWAMSRSARSLARPGRVEHRRGQQQPRAARRRAGGRRRPHLCGRYQAVRARLQHVTADWRARSWQDAGRQSRRRITSDAAPVRRRRQLSTMAASMRPTASATSPRSTPRPARRSGRSGPAGRCAARRPSPTTMSMWSARTTSCSRSTPPTATIRWQAAGLARAGRRVRRRRARRRAGHGGRRLLVGRAHRLSLREWPRRSGRTC